MNYCESDFYFIPSSKDKMFKIREELEPADTMGNRLYFFIREYAGATAPGQKRQIEDKVRKQQMDLINRVKACDPKGEVVDQSDIIWTNEGLP